MSGRLTHVHDLALNGDEGWKVGDVVNLSHHRLDTEDRDWLIVERDEASGHWYLTQI